MRYVLYFFYLCLLIFCLFFFFSSRRRHTRFDCDWSSDVCSSDLESMPAFRNMGDTVYAGTVLLAGSLRMRVTSVGTQTVVGRLIQRVEETQELDRKSVV